jgi:hypothetical protein
VGTLDCLAACTALLLGAATSVASAKPGYYVSSPSRSAILQPKNSRGYAITIFSFDSRHLLLAATKPSGSAAYYVPRRASKPDEIEASFGKLGRISMHFEPSGPAEAQPEPGGECVGKAPNRQRGHFVGNLRFRGEGGFIAVHSTDLRGEVFRSFKRVCARPQEPKNGFRKPRPVSLSAYVKGDPLSPTFSAYKLAGRGGFGSASASY